MEASPFSSVASRHLSATSPSLPFCRNLSNSKFSRKPTGACSSSSWTGSTHSVLFSSRNSFTREVWGVINSKSIVTVKREMRGVIRAEMFGQLTSGLEAAWNKLKGEEVLTKENIVEPMIDIRRALLEADISLSKLLVLAEFKESNISLHVDLHSSTLGAPRLDCT
ncbi:unnamed protein product [Ilex paraguariensis]|uniref:Signal recognition particle SRP54 helical bundle domain-containing protein n=1 Tax=Ilex paraguariensis TaxID=185542 RepID=A0ABC8T554_9AQUA